MTQRLPQWAHRTPFTLILLLALGAVGWITKSYAQPLPDRWRQRLGLAPVDLHRGPSWRLGTMSVTTDGGLLLWSALGLSAVIGGAAEWLVGTKRTVITFAGVHLLTWLLEAWLVVPWLARRDLALDGALLTARDVGPSAGYVACLALLVHALPARWRWRSALALGGGFLAMPFVRVYVWQHRNAALILADLAHLIAFPLGWLAAMGSQLRRLS